MAETMKEEMVGTDGKDLPLDRGWAWVITFAASSLYFLAYGGFKTQGIILVEVTEKFEGTTESANLWLFSANFIICTLLGPLTSHLIMTVGHRIIAICGVVFLSLAHIGLAVSPSLHLSYLLYSVPAGIGNSFLILSALLISNEYFIKKKALALGLIAAGSGFGSFVISYLIRFLFDELGYRSALIVYATFILQFIVLAALLRPISYYSRVRKIQSFHTPLYSSEGDDLNDIPAQTLDIGLLLPPSPSRSRDKIISSHQELEKPTLRSWHDDGAYSRSAPTVSNEDDEPASTSDFLQALRADAMTGSMILANLDTNLSEDKNGRQPGEEVKPMRGFDWRVLFLPKMIMLGLSILTFCFATSILYQSLPALAKESGVPKETIALVLMIGGFVEMFARIAQGSFADKKIMTATSQTAVNMLITGVCVIVCASVSALPGAIMAVLGMSVAGTAIFNIMPVVILEILEPQHITTAMGTQFLYQAVAFMISTPVAGAIYRLSGRWEDVFFYMASGMLTGGLILTPYVVYTWYTRRWAEQSKQTTSPS